MKSSMWFSPVFSACEALAARTLNVATSVSRRAYDRCWARGCFGGLYAFVFDCLVMSRMPDSSVGMIRAHGAFDGALDVVSDVVSDAAWSRDCAHVRVRCDARCDDVMLISE